jgi:hypothetical protein
MAGRLACVALGLFAMVRVASAKTLIDYFLPTPIVTNWKDMGVAYDPRASFIRYTDGTVNKWNNLERPNVVIENGHVTHFTFAATDVDKSSITGTDNHGSKILVVPFDGVAFDTDNGCETGTGGSGGAGAGGAGGAGTGGSSGGTGGRGGASGTGGMSASAATPASGGAPASGGNPGTGGATGTGGGAGGNWATTSSGGTSGASSARGGSAGASTASRSTANGCACGLGGATKGLGAWWSLLLGSLVGVRALRQRRRPGRG